MDDVLDEIRALPRTRPFTCCGRTDHVSTLDIYRQCSACGKTTKLRGFGGIGTEIQDVIDAVLRWMGTGEDFERAMLRKRVIDEAPPE